MSPLIIPVLGIMCGIIAIIGGLGSKMYRDWLTHKREMGQALTAETAEKAAQYAAHTERLEQRVRVLERIVTDKGIGLADEIEQLGADRVKGGKLGLGDKPMNQFEMIAFIVLVVTVGSVLRAAF